MISLIESREIAEPSYSPTAKLDSYLLVAGLVMTAAYIALFSFSIVPFDLIYILSGAIPIGLTLGSGAFLYGIRKIVEHDFNKWKHPKGIGVVA